MIAFPKNKIYRNVSDSQWAAWQKEIDDYYAKYTKYGLYWMVLTKAFEENLYWPSLSSSPGPERILLQQMADIGAIEIERVNVLIEAIKLHQFDPAYTGSEIPVSVSIPDYPIDPETYLNTPIRGTDIIPTQEELRSASDGRWARAYGSAQALADAAANEAANIAVVSPTPEHIQAAQDAANAAAAIRAAADQAEQDAADAEFQLENTFDILGIRVPKTVAYIAIAGVAFLLVRKFLGHK